MNWMQINAIVIKNNYIANLVNKLVHCNVGPCIALLKEEMCYTDKNSKKYIRGPQVIYAHYPAKLTFFCK